jgi:pSer/pThr/pTyr-binding forkhead associated (FHA) protein
MAKLHFSLEGNSLGEFGLDKERITIGRRSGNDIHIDNLAVSGDHAIITTIGNDSFLEDLDSTNGTLVNSKSVKKHVLHHGDIIEFGKYQLKYVNQTQENMPANRNGFENTAVMRPAKPKVAAPAAKAEVETISNGPTSAPSNVNDIPAAPVLAPAPVAIAPAAAIASAGSVAGAQILGHLQTLSGPNSGQELLLNKALTTLGKPGVQLAVITKRPNGYFISHVEGDKMPLVNGQAIGAKAHALSDHDVIDLEGIKMEFYLA